MNTFFVIAIAGVQLAMIAALQNRLRELRADLESYKLGETMRQVIDLAPSHPAELEGVRSSWKSAA